jgi:ABC-type Na+ efflux pump permease subunit
VLGEPGRVEAHPLLWVVATVLVLVGSVVLAKLPDYWRAGESFARVQRVVRPLGEPLRTSVAAAMPVSGFGAVVCGFLIVLVILNESASESVRNVAELASFVVVPVFLIVLLLLFGVLLVGRPRVIVPPIIRDHRGLIGEALTGRRGTRSDNSKTG